MTKKILLFSTLISFLALLLLPQMTEAGVVTVAIANLQSGYNITVATVQVNGSAYTTSGSITQVTVNGVLAQLTPTAGPGTVLFVVSIPCADSISATAADSDGMSDTDTITGQCAAAAGGGGGGNKLLEKCTITRDVGEPVDCPVGQFCNFDTNPKCGVCCLLQTLYNVTDWIFFILLGVAAIYVIIGAMNLLMSAGDPGKVSSGRNYIMYALIGLILALLARTIPAIAKLVVGS
ncbi:MAG: hypothetical protein ABIG08_01705 [bacterium]